MKSQVVDKTVAIWFGLNAFSGRQSIFMAKLELPRLMSGRLLQKSVILVLAFSLGTALETSISFGILLRLVSSGSFECHRGL